MVTERHPVRWLLVLLALAATVRGVHLILTMDDAYLGVRVGDELHYHQWAVAIAQGALGRGAAFFTSPLFAYGLAGVYRAFGESVAVLRILQAVLGLATMWLVYVAARRVLPPRPAVVAAALVGFAAPVIFYESLPDKSTLVLCATAAAFAAVAWSQESTGLWRWCLTGAVVGLGGLAHELLLVMVPVVWLDLIVEWARSRRPHELQAVAAFTAACGLAILPATIHNYRQDGSLVLIGSNGGQNFYTGNHAGNLSGLYTSPPFAHANLASEEADYTREAERRLGRAMRPSEVSAYWYGQAWKAIAAHPALSLARFGRRLRWTMGDAEISDTRTYEFYQDRFAVLRLPLWGFGVLSVLGIPGLLLRASDRRYLVPASFVVLYAISLSAFFVYGRYRLPLAIPLAILGAGALSIAWDLVARRQWARLLAVSLLAIPASWLAFGRVTGVETVSFFPDYFNQGNRYYALGQYDRAAAEYEKALFVRPGDHPAVPQLASALADLYVQMGNPARAQAMLREVLATGAASPALSQKLATLTEEPR